MGRKVTRLALAIGLAAGALAFPAAASATVACDFDSPTRVLSATSSDPDETLILTRDHAQIKVLERDSGGVTCSGGIPSITNTDIIVLAFTGSGASFGPWLNLANGPLAPGFTDEPGNSDEIEILIADFDQGPFINHIGFTSPESIRLGTAGINLNVLEEAGVGDPSDADVGAESFANTAVSTAGGDDVVDAGGGAGTGGIAPYDVSIDGGPGDDDLLGGAGRDLIEAGAGSDFVFAGPGDDFVAGDPLIDPASAGDDTLAGGTGIDEVIYTNAPGGVRVNLAKTAAQDTGAEGTDRLSGFEGVKGSLHADVLIGTADDDTLDGDHGNDVLQGRGGDDELRGDAGVDTASYAAGGGAVTVDLRVVAAQSTGGAGTDLLTGVERLIGSPFADRLIGNGAPNVITGLAGRDVLAGGGAADRLRIRDGGRDVTRCGGGPDSVQADGPGIDLISADCETLLP